jgi:hypothetical protein
VSADDAETVCVACDSGDTVYSVHTTVSMWFFIKSDNKFNEINRALFESPCILHETVLSNVPHKNVKKYTLS